MMIVNVVVGVCYVLCAMVMVVIVLGIFGLELET
jgi:hypothetical protein